MVIVGVIAHGDPLEDSLPQWQGGDAGAGPPGQQMLLQHQIVGPQTPALAPVGHQGQGLSSLEGAGPGGGGAGEQTLKAQAAGTEIGRAHV